MLPRIIIKEACWSSLITSEGKSPSGQQTTIALKLLNNLINNLNTEGFMSFSVVDKVVTPNSDYVTIGDNGQIDDVRPSSILSSYVYDGTSWIQLDAVSYTDIIGYKENTVSRPYYYAYKADYPLAQVHFDCTPNNQVKILYSKPIPTILLSEIDTDLGIPPEYDTLLVSGLTWMISEFYKLETSEQAKNMYMVDRDAIKNTAMFNTPITITMERLNNSAWGC